MLIRELAQKLDSGFKKFKLHYGGLEDGLFRGGSDDGYSDARQSLNLILDEDDFVKKEMVEEFGCVDEYGKVKLDELRATFSEEEMAMLEELKFIMVTLGGY